MKQDSKQSFGGVDLSRIRRAQGRTRAVTGAATSGGLGGSSPLALALGLAGVAALAWPAGAHPGHGLAEAGAAHLLTSPYHLMVLVGTALALAVGARLVQQARIRRWMQLGAALATGMALAVWLTY